MIVPPPLWADLFRLRSDPFRSISSLIPYLLGPTVSSLAIDPSLLCSRIYWPDELRPDPIRSRISVLRMGPMHPIRSCDSVLRMGPTHRSIHPCSSCC